MTDATSNKGSFSHDHYLIRSKLFRLFGGAFHVYDGDGGLVLYTDQKRFRLKEDLRVYADESKAEELLRINTQSVFDISGAYDVSDSRAGERVGTLQRRGLASFLRDRWDVLDASGEHLGTLQEDSMAKALFRRLLGDWSFFMPQRYHLEVAGQTVATYRQRFNPIILKLEVDFSGDSDNRLDRRLGLAAAILLNAIEGRQ
jgi:uncharacterized protein YxjI